MKPYVIVALTTYADLNREQFGSDLFSLISARFHGMINLLARSLVPWKDFSSLGAY